MANRYIDAVTGSRASRGDANWDGGKGLLEWGLSKVPAGVGGHLADYAWNYGVKRLPKGWIDKYGVDFIGGLFVAFAGYVLQLAATSWARDRVALVDRMVDGMIGRIAPELTRQLWSRFKSLGEGGAAGANGPANGVCCDGDDQAVRDIAQLLRDSPETTQEFADGMIAVMRRDGIDINRDGEAAVVRSLREVSSNLARGQA